MEMTARQRRVPRRRPDRRGCAMSVQTPAERTSLVPPSTTRFDRVVRSEAVKMFSLRSTGWTLLAMFVVTVGFGMLICWGIVAGVAGGPGGTEWASLPLDRPGSGTARAGGAGCDDRVVGVHDRRHPLHAHRGPGPAAPAVRQGPGVPGRRHRGGAWWCASPRSRWRAVHRRVTSTGSWRPGRASTAGRRCPLRGRQRHVRLCVRRAATADRGGYHGRGRVPDRLPPLSQLLPGDWGDWITRTSPATPACR